MQSKSLQKPIKSFAYFANCWYKLLQSTLLKFRWNIAPLLMILPLISRCLLVRGMWPKGKFYAVDDNVQKVEWWLLKSKDMHFSKILEVFFNKQLCRGRSVIENSFCILKKTLLLKTNLHVLFLLDVVVCCCIPYNMIPNRILTLTYCWLS
jgi:hypothetical protein